LPASGHLGYTDNEGKVVASASRSSVRAVMTGMVATQQVTLAAGDYRNNSGDDRNLIEKQ